jgi:hypothetical protein
MTDNAQNKPQQQRPAPDRTPIHIDRLMFWSDKPTMMGIRIPQGNESKGEEQRHDLLAGIQGSDKVEIEHRPWLRVFRVARFRRQTSTGPKGEIETWVPWGKPFHIPDIWAVSIPAEE